MVALEPSESCPKSSVKLDEVGRKDGNDEGKDDVGFSLRFLLGLVLGAKVVSSPQLMLQNSGHPSIAPGLRQRSSANVPIQSQFLPFSASTKVGSLMQGLVEGFIETVSILVGLVDG